MTVSKKVNVPRHRIGLTAGLTAAISLGLSVPVVAVRFKGRFTQKSERASTVEQKEKKRKKKSNWRIVSALSLKIKKGIPCEGPDVPTLRLYINAANQVRN